MKFIPTEQYEIVDTYRGFQYAIYFQDMQGFRCGYVRIPEDHPFFEKPFTEIYMNTLELTFSGHIKHLDGWYIGWDHHHLWEGVDYDSIKAAHSNLSKDELNEIIEYAHSMSGNPGGLSYSKNDVENECHEVIDELLDKFIFT